MHIDIARTLLVPGWAAWERRRPLALALFVGGVVVPVGVALQALVSGRNWVALSLDAGFLALVLVAGVAAIATRIVGLAEVWATRGRPTSLDRRELTAVLGAALALVAGSVAVAEVGRARRSIEPTFAGSTAVPLFDADGIAGPTSATATSTTAVATTEPLTSTAPRPAPLQTVPTIAPGTTPGTTTTTTLPPLPRRPDSGVDPALLAEVSTVLLIGGDAGPGRAGLRTDAMLLLSVHRPSGRAALVSIPRDMRLLLFPPGSALGERYPYGYRGLANAVYPEVSSDRGLRDAYAVDGVRPGVVALAQGIGYSLDVTIHDYVLVDMQGFLDLIDAVGGVTVTVSKRIPMPGNVPGAPAQYPDTIGPGIVQMDGSTALGYVRSRKGDNDYRRTQRQRELLAALAQQISLPDVALSIGDVAAAVGGTLRTSLTPDELVDALNVIGGETAIVESLGLVPPLVNVERPDLGRMAEVVGAVRLALTTGVPSGY